MAVTPIEIVRLTVGRVRAVADRDLQVGDVGAQPFGDAARVGLAGLGQQQHELLAAEPARAVVVAQVAGEGLRRRT